MKMKNWRVLPRDEPDTSGHTFCYSMWPKEVSLAFSLMPVCCQWSLSAFVWERQFTFTLEKCFCWILNSVLTGFLLLVLKKIFLLCLWLASFLEMAAPVLFPYIYRLFPSACFQGFIFVFNISYDTSRYGFFLMFLIYLLGVWWDF